jgi:hypothetical protein
VSARRLAAALWIAAAFSAAATAHELGTVRVVARFEKGGRYEIDAIVDRQHLPPGVGADAAVHRTRIAFDGRAVAPSVALVLPAGGTATMADAPELTVRFSGTVPAGAKVFTWSNAVPLGSYMLTIRAEGQPEASRQWIEGAAESVPFPIGEGIAPVTRAEVIRRYLRLGFTHIVPKGADHILFVCGIFLLAGRLRPVLAQVSAFTAAHTLTLALTVYGVVSLPPRVVEPLIALSIVAVAVENVLAPALTPWRVAVVFAFGLLHGMGFAGVLSGLGLPRHQFVPALLSFNAGVELGQLAVVAILALLVALPFRKETWYRRRVVVPASLAIAAVGLVWFVERVAA